MNARKEKTPLEKNETNWNLEVFWVYGMDIEFDCNKKITTHAMLPALNSLWLSTSIRIQTLQYIWSNEGSTMSHTWQSNLEHILTAFNWLTLALLHSLFMFLWHFLPLALAVQLTYLHFLSFFNAPIAPGRNDTEWPFLINTTTTLLRSTNNWLCNQNSRVNKR